MAAAKKAVTTETGAERYRRLTADQAEIVDVTVPSGFVFTFEKPSKFGMLFGLGELPTTATAEAMAAWRKDGIGEPHETAPVVDDDTATQTVFEIRDRVLALSRSPKIVKGDANEENDEISQRDIVDSDLEFLFGWVASGGTASLMLGTFPQGSQPSTLASPNRQARRAAAK